MWAAGCILAGMLFKTTSFFKGRNNYRQFLKIVRVLGTDDLFKYEKKYNASLKFEGLDKMRDLYYEKIPWDTFIDPSNFHIVKDDALDLLDKMLVYDHNERINTRDAMAHHYFDPIRDFVK